MRLAGLPVALALAVLAAGVAGAAAQEPPQPADTAAVPDTLPPPPPPRPAYEPPRLALSLGFGVLGFGDLQTQPVLAERLAPDGTVTSSVALRRTLSARTGVHVGGSVVVGFSPAWAVRVGGAVGRASLQSGYAGEDDAFVDEAAAVEEPGNASLDILLMEAALRFRVPSGRRVQPWVELGAGAVRWSRGGGGADPFPGGESVGEGETRWGPVLALGGDIPLLPRVSARLQASTRWLRTPFDPGADGAFVGQGDSLALSFRQPADGRFADPTLELTRVLRLEAGLSLELGRIRPRGRARPGSGESGSGSPR